MSIDKRIAQCLKNAKKGGEARAKSLSPKRRKDIARKAAMTRWITKKLLTESASKGVTQNLSTGNFTASIL